MTVINLEDGKYTVTSEACVLSFKRYGQEWPAADDLRHSHVVLALVQRIEALQDQLACMPSTTAGLPQ